MDTQEGSTETESNDLQDAAKALDSNNTKQAITGGLVVLFLLISCLAFVGGVVYTAHQISYTTNIYYGVKDEALPSWYGKRP